MNFFVENENSLEKIIADINKIVGNDGATIGEQSIVEPLSTGILPLDVALGIGGLPKGRVIEIHSGFSIGKSSLCYAIMAHLQKQGMYTALIDTEYTFLSDYAEVFGVDMNKMILVRTATGEQALEAAEKLIKSGKVAMVVIDSVSGLIPQSEAEADHGKFTIGAQAKLISKGLSKIVGPLYKSGAILILINQLRQNIMGGQYDPFILPGGLALKHYSSVMLELKRKATLKQAEKIIGLEIEITVKKNKVGMPGEKCVTQLLYGRGFSGEADILDAGFKMGLITVTGNSWWYNSTKLGVGQGRARKYLEEHPELAEEIKSKLTVDNSTAKNKEI